MKKEFLYRFGSSRLQGKHFIDSRMFKQQDFVEAVKLGTEGCRQCSLEMFKGGQGPGGQNARKPRGSE